MEKTFTKTVSQFANLLAMCLLTVTLLSCANPLMASSDYASSRKQGESTPFEQLQNIMKKHHYDVSTLSVIDSLDVFDLLKMYSDITSTFDIYFSDYKDSRTVGELLTTILQSAEGKHKANARGLYNDYRYSSNAEDYTNYLYKYPKSKFTFEMIEKNLCLQLVNAWEVARDSNTLQSYRSFVEYYACCYLAHCFAVSGCKNATDNFPQFKYEGFENIDVQSFVESAKTRIAEIEAYNEQVRSSWEKATAANTYDAYLDYRRQFPESDSAAIASEKLRQFEQSAWDTAKAENNRKAYLKFSNLFPEGYYCGQAASRLVDIYLDTAAEPAAFHTLKTCGKYSRPGYSIICIGNIGKEKTISVTIKGESGCRRVLEVGQYQWVEVKNGNYTIVAESDTVSWWGEVKCDERIYVGAWVVYTYRYVNDYKLNPEKYQNEQTIKRMEKALSEKCGYPVEFVKRGKLRRYEPILNSLH